VLARVLADVHGGATYASTSDVERFADAVVWPLERPAPSREAPTWW
jgi:hypothetical protein